LKGKNAVGQRRARSVAEEGASCSVALMDWKITANRSVQAAVLRTSTFVTLQQRVHRVRRSGSSTRAACSV
jgi:hypothetical protein